MTAPASSPSTLSAQPLPTPRRILTAARIVSLLGLVPVLYVFWFAAVVLADPLVREGQVQLIASAAVALALFVYASIPSRRSQQHLIAAALGAGLLVLVFASDISLLLFLVLIAGSGV